MYSEQTTRREKTTDIQHTKRNALHFLQTNLGRSYKAHDVAYATALEFKVDIAIASEPNKKTVERGAWICDDNLDVAVRLLNSNLVVQKINKYGGMVKISLLRFDLICCYISPNCILQDFETFTNNLRSVLANSDRNFVVTGDFNAKSSCWGFPINDHRGDMLAEMMAGLGVSALNRGDMPTFVRDNSKTFIDVTFASPSMVGKVTDWQTLENEPMSHHKHIYFAVKDESPPKRLFKDKVRLDRAKLKFLLDSANYTSQLEDPKRFAFTIKKLYQLANTGGATRQERAVPYWWNDDIERKRAECISDRRTYTRLLSDTHNPNLAAAAKTKYKDSKRDLNRLIRQSKREHWRGLCSELNDDIWGQGYRLVMQNLKSTPLPFQLAEQRKMKIISALFPTRQDILTKEDLEEEPTEFSIKELNEAAAKLKTGKAPGPDGIPAEMVKELVQCAPIPLLRSMNAILKEQKIPNHLKKARLLLLLKPDKPMDLDNSFRPLCLINSLAKLVEHLIKSRVETALESDGDLAKNQFGFRKGMCTIHAIDRVLELGRNGKLNGRGQKWAVLVTLDVKNAFNSVSFAGIIQAL